MYTYVFIATLDMGYHRGSLQFPTSERPCGAQTQSVAAVPNHKVAPQSATLSLRCPIPECQSVLAVPNHHVAVQNSMISLQRPTRVSLQCPAPESFDAVPNLSVPGLKNVDA